MDVDEGNKKIRLMSKDDTVFEITAKEGKIAQLILDATDENDDEEAEIVIARVGPECLGKVVDFMKHYAVEKMKEIPTPLGGSTFNEVRRFAAAKLWPARLVIADVANVTSPLASGD